MTTLEALEQSYDAAARELHHASINGRADEASTWCLVMSQIMRQLEHFPNCSISKVEMS